MMACRSTSASTRRSLMEVLHFPDDPRPPWLVHPVLALGNFDGLHRGHLKIIERVKRGAVEHGGTPMAMTFDPHPPQVVRPDKAPPLLMTKDAADRRARQGGHPLRRRRPFHARAVAVGSGDVRAHRAGRMAARVGSLGRREFPVRTRAQRQLHGAADARPALRLSRRKDRSGALQGIRRQQHAHPPPGRGGAHGRGGGAARPSVLAGRHGRRGAAARPRDLGFRRRTS